MLADQAGLSIVRKRALLQPSERRSTSQTSADSSLSLHPPLQVAKLHGACRVPDDAETPSVEITELVSRTEKSIVSLCLSALNDMQPLKALVGEEPDKVWWNREGPKEMGLEDGGQKGRLTDVRTVLCHGHQHRPKTRSQTRPPECSQTYQKL